MPYYPTYKRNLGNHIYLGITIPLFLWNIEGGESGSYQFVNENFYNYIKFTSDFIELPSGDLITYTEGGLALFQAYVASYYS